MMIVEKVGFELALNLRYYFEILCGLVRAWRPVIESREAKPRKTTLIAQKGYIVLASLKVTWFLLE